MFSTAIGSSPENGSSRMSRLGSWTSAIASCTRCWLPLDKACTSSLARSATPTRSIHSCAAVAASPADRPASRAKYTS